MRKHHDELSEIQSMIHRSRTFLVVGRAAGSCTWRFRVVTHLRIAAEFSALMSKRGALAAELPAGLAAALLADFAVALPVRLAAALTAAVLTASLTAAFTFAGAPAGDLRTRDSFIVRSWVQAARCAFCASWETSTSS